MSGILSLSTDKQVGLWSRVAGDGLDIATLMTAMRQDNPKHDNAAGALATVLGVTVLDILGAQGVTARHNRSDRRPRSYQIEPASQGVQAARGAARNFKTPADMSATPALPAAFVPPERARLS